MKERLLAIVLCCLMLILSACSVDPVSSSEESPTGSVVSEESTETSRMEENLDVPKSPLHQTDSSSQAIDKENGSQTPVFQTDSESIGANRSPVEEPTSEATPDTVTASEPVTEPVTEPVQNQPQEPDSKPDPEPGTTQEKPPEQAPGAETTESSAPAFDVSGYVGIAKSYGQFIGLKLDSSATACWDDPIYANADSLYIQRDIQDTLNWYKESGFTSFWVWTENLGNNDYHIYIGYA